MRITVDADGDEAAAHDLYNWLRQDRELRRHAKAELTQASEAPGCMNAGEIGGDVSATLADIATRALRRLMPGASGPAIYHDGVPSLERLLKSSRLPQICRHPR
ncbi:effector-associated constant component EACC1 [Streptomyces katsurahamanus]|uniref:Uncharacterized protein n=1 Tax=Streptomyces katsurahamanus TaxID=2577098 RepID=A0ABW9NWF0_9ACTN|nr:hypothetical protein [Streptomyces katsurahamanus]MQS37650.1 hypothetical protein [Streptomyces katsurahamanus]